MGIPPSPELSDGCSRSGEGWRVGWGLDEDGGGGGGYLKGYVPSG